MLNHALTALCRRDGGRILATLIREFRDFDVAEEALQDAYEKALQHWPTAGVPADPSAWLYTVARRRGIDVVRKLAPLREDPALLDALPAPAGEADDEHAHFGAAD